MNYPQEIYKLITNYLPLTETELGSVIPIISVSKSGSDLILELSSSDYDFVIDQIDTYGNYSYTASNFKVKNNISSFIPYPESANYQFGFLVKFERMINKDNGDDIPLNGFNDNNFNTNYRIVRKIDDYNIILAPLNDLTIEEPIGSLGFYSTLYSGGLNGVKTISDEGANSISFTLDENTLSSIDSVDDLDLTTMPNLWFYQDNILVMDFDTFTRNLADQENDEFLVIDSTSLVGSPMRSSKNNTDAAYFSFGTNAYFYREYTIDLFYMLQRSVDDENNQTESGTDIAEKQVAMFESLNSLLRRPIQVDNNKKVISSLTITNDEVNKKIMEGYTVINYQASFVVNFLPDSIKNISDEGSYNINQINYNTDEIIV